MAGFGKREKGWLIFSIIWFVATIVLIYSDFEVFLYVAMLRNPDGVLAQIVAVILILNVPILIGWAIWCGKNLPPAGRAIKVLKIVTGIWFFMVFLLTKSAVGLSEINDAFRYLKPLLILNSPFIFFWGTKWIFKR